MYHAACKVEFQPFKRLYSQLTFFNFLISLTYIYTRQIDNKILRLNTQDMMRNQE